MRIKKIFLLIILSLLLIPGVVFAKTVKSTASHQINEDT